MRPRIFSCPEEALAGEIELAIAYTTACNLHRARELLLAAPDGCRQEFAAALAVMLKERAERGLSGMAIADDAPAGARK